MEIYALMHLINHKMPDESEDEFNSGYKSDNDDNEFEKSSKKN